MSNRPLALPALLAITLLVSTDASAFGIPPFCKSVESADPNGEVCNNKGNPPYNDNRPVYYAPAGAWICCDRAPYLDGFAPVAPQERKADKTRESSSDRVDSAPATTVDPAAPPAHRP